MSEAGIYKAICNVMGDIAAIGKDQKNVKQGFNFRGIDDVYNGIHPLFKKHGVFSYCSKIETIDRNEITSKGGGKGFQIINEYTYRFCAEDGSSFDVMARGEAMDYGDKSSNKAAAIAHKYAILQTFCIPTADLEDPDASVHDVKEVKKPTPKQTPLKPSAVYKGEPMQKQALADLFDTLNIETKNKRIIHDTLIAWKTPYNKDMVAVVSKIEEKLNTGEPIPEIPF